MAESKKDKNKYKPVSRRDFLARGGAVIAAGAFGVYAAEPTTVLAKATASYEPSTGYIVYDSRLCLGCQSCMFACSMTHEGVGNPAVENSDNS